MIVVTLLALVTVAAYIAFLCYEPWLASGLAGIHCAWVGGTSLGNGATSTAVLALAWFAYAGVALPLVAAATRRTLEA